MLRNALTTLAATLSWTVCEAAENTGIAMNDGVELAYWVHGSDDGIPLIVINGQGAAARPEGDGLTTALVAHGFRVILFDNRDLVKARSCTRSERRQAGQRLPRHWKPAPSLRWLMICPTWRVIPSPSLMRQVSNAHIFWVIHWAA